MPPHRATPVQTPCCVGGFLKANPESTEFFCAKCGKVFSTVDLLDMLDIPTKAAMPKMVPVTGNTYPVKEELKLLGARWNQADRVWMVPDSKLIEAQRIVRRGPTGGPDADALNAADNEWQRKRERDKWRAVQQEPKFRLETRVCWECGMEFTEPDPVLVALEADGATAAVWEQFWCGCTDAKRVLKKAPEPEDEDDDMPVSRW